MAQRELRDCAPGCHNRRGPIVICAQCAKSWRVEAGPPPPRGQRVGRLGITHRRTAYHHPEGNSYIERFHRSLKEEEVWTAEYRSVEEAWEIRGTRAVYGLLIVESDAASTNGSVPERWRKVGQACLLTSIGGHCLTKFRAPAPNGSSQPTIQGASSAVRKQCRLRSGRRGQLPVRP